MVRARTEEMFLFLVRVHLLVLVRYAALFEHDPDALHEWTELMDWSDAET